MSDKHIPLSQAMLDRVYRGEFIPCSAMHPHSCEMNALKKWWVVFAMAYKFYIPIHGIPCLIYKRK